MSQILLESLRNKGWGDRYGVYNRFFEFMNHLNEIDAPCMSIIMISWRLHGDTLENLRRVHEQRRDVRVEVIFVDNGGQEGEFDCVKIYVDKFIRLNRNTGSCIARNIGAAFTVSPLLFFLEDDGIADRHLVEAHVLVHKRFDIFALRGACLPKTDNPLNERQNHYYLGDAYFPMYASIEGNTSYKSDKFFEVGGWNDDIVFGGEGKDLAIRLYRKYPNYSKQIYAPICIIYHDYAANGEHLSIKLERQAESNRMLAATYPEWQSFGGNYAELLGRSNLLMENREWASDLTNQKRFQRVSGMIMTDNLEKINNAFLVSRIFRYQKERLVRLFDEIKMNRKICIFGTGALADKVSETFVDLGIPIDCFADNNSVLWNQNKQGKLIVSTDQLTKAWYVFIASSWFHEIASQLEALGYMKGQDYLIIS